MSNATFSFGYLVEPTSLIERGDWQDDYSPETGMTGICPACESRDVEFTGDAKRQQCRWECTDCGAYSEWQ